MSYHKRIIIIIKVTVVLIKVVSPLRGCLKATITGEVANLIKDQETTKKQTGYWTSLKRPSNMKDEAENWFLESSGYVIPCQVKTVVGALHLNESGG